MKKTLTTLMLLSALHAGAENPAREAVADDQPLGYSTAYFINPQARLQQNEGWGVSLCWWANMCGKWSDAQIDRLVDWLVSPTGLNFNIFRYNIGGGDDPSNANCEPHHMGKGKGLRAEMEGFQDEPGGPYHWERDEAQRKIMLKIREKRPDAIFEAFSNSAPWWMTVSGCVGGHKDANTDNLKPEYYEAFCHYLVDVCKHYKEEYGIEFKTLEPFNEPVTNYWYQGGSQEGCHVSVQAQIDILKVLAPILKESGLSTIIAASDETDAGQSVIDIKEYKKAGVLNLVGQWNTHTYSANNRNRSQVGLLAREAGKMLWMSEVGAGGNGLQGNLSLCQKLFDDVRYIMPDAWLDWQYVEEYGDQWCLVNSPFDQPLKAQRVKNYYVRQQVTRFIKQGYYFVTTPCEQALAAVSPGSDTLVIALLNHEKVPTTHSIALPFTKVEGQARAYRTSATESLKQVDAKSIIQADGTLRLELPAQSITTLLIPIQVDDAPSEALLDGDTYYILPQCNHALGLSAAGDGVEVQTLALDNPAQQWTLHHMSSSVYRLENGNGDYISTSSGYFLGLSQENSPAQNFRILPTDDFVYRVLARTGNSSFDLQGNGLASGTKVGMYTYGTLGEAETRHWHFLRYASGSSSGDAIDTTPRDNPLHPGTPTCYTLSGQQTTAPRKGISLLRLAHGTIRKVLQ